MPTVTRFAPSPTGQLHLGHAYAAIFAHDMARSSGGRFLLRIEDIDAGRCRPEIEAAIEEDLAWLGLDWERPVRRQSQHMSDYAAALTELRDAGLVYPCFCTRAEIRAEIERAADAPQGPDGPIYPGTCRTLTQDERKQRMARGDSYALRLDMSAAISRAGRLDWVDRARGRVTATPETFGDVILARKDTPASYHLAVTLDDAIQGVTLVTRGEDLAPATDIHRLLQMLLDLPVPEYHHHKIVTDDAGRRLAKRDRAATLHSLREDGRTAEEIRAMIGLA